MANLTDTDNITLHQKYTFKDGRAYYTVPAFGDGNCALNAFALSLIDAIKRNELRLTNNKQQLLMASIAGAMSLNALKQRLKFYCGKPSTTKNSRNPYADVAHDLEAFIQFIERKPSYAELCQYINAQHSRHAIAALQVGLAPALRQLGVEAYLDKLKKVLNVNHDSAHPLIKDAISLFDDATDAGQEVLSHLAHDFFGVNLSLYESDLRKVQTAKPRLRVPTCAIIHYPDSAGHFDCLLPVSSVVANQGLAADLAGVHVELISKFSHQNHVLRSHTYLSKNHVAKVSAIASKAAKAVLDITIPLDQCLRTHAAKKLMTLSDEAVTTVKSKLDISDVKLDALSVKFKLQKELLQNGVTNVVGEMSEDEVIARTMQNAEILSFYENHHALLAHDDFCGGRTNASARSARPGLFNLGSSTSVDASTDVVAATRPKRR